MYTEQTVGIFIQDIYGNLYTEDEWDGTQTANGVAVIASECNFVITPYVTSGNLYVTDVYELSDTLLPILTEEQALLDCDGQSNTDILYDVLTDGIINVFKRNHSKQGCSIYLHAAGEAYLFVTNFPKIKSCLEIISSFTSTSLNLITSSRADESKLWCISRDSNGDISIIQESPYSRFNVLGLTKYYTSDDIVEFSCKSGTRGTLTFKAVKGTKPSDWEYSAFNTTLASGDESDAFHTYMGAFSSLWEYDQPIQGGESYSFVEPL